MKISEIIDVIEQVAPLDMAEAWDNCGLQVGSANIECKAAFLTLDVTPDVVTVANKCGANLIISHHPLIFDPIRNVNDQSTVGKIICDVIAKGITIYASHTPFDIAVGGINDYLAQSFQLHGVASLTETGMGRVGYLEQSMTADKFVELVKEKLDLKSVRTSAKMATSINRVALCGGSGGSLIEQAVKSGADVYVTGDIKYNNFVDNQIPIIDVGHFESEKQFIELIDALISKKIPTFASHVDLSNPTQIR